MRLHQHLCSRYHLGVRDGNSHPGHPALRYHPGRRRQSLEVGTSLTSYIRCSGASGSQPACELCTHGKGEFNFSPLLCKTLSPNRHPPPPPGRGFGPNTWVRLKRLAEPPPCSPKHRPASGSTSSLAQQFSRRAHPAGHCENTMTPKASEYTCWGRGVLLRLASLGVTLGQLFAVAG